MVIIITPNWLRVDKAITFFMSNSRIAPSPAINIVKTPTNIKYFNKSKDINKKLKRISRYTPAVTRVEEWTSAETGVGAAIAAGSQAEKGICALLVILAQIRMTKISLISAEGI